MQNVDRRQRQSTALSERVESAVDDGRWDVIARELDEHFFALSISTPEVVDRVWERASDEWLASHPRYLMAEAVSRARTRPFAVIDPSVERVFAAWVLSQPNPSTRDLLAVRLAATRRHVSAGRLTHATRAADEIHDLITTTDDHEGLEDLLPIALARCGIVQLLRGSLDDAIGSFSEAWRWSRSTSHPFTSIAAAHCALVHALTGDYVQAEAWRARSTEASARAADVPTPRFSNAGRLADALLAIGALDQKRALQAAAELEVGIESGELWWVGVHARCRIALFWGDRAPAIRELEADLRAFPSLTTPVSLAGLILRSDLADLFQAEGDLDAAEKQLAELDVVRPHPAAVGSIARQFVLRGDARAAHAILDAAVASPLLRCQPPAQWYVIRANLDQATASTVDDSVVSRARERICLTGSYDAAADASATVRPALIAGLGVPSVPDVPFVRRGVTLTRRERQILDVLAENSSVKDIAAALFISPNTAKSHLRHIYRKLDVDNRTQALRVGRKQF